MRTYTGSEIKNNILDEKTIDVAQDLCEVEYVRLCDIKNLEHLKFLGKLK